MVEHSLEDGDADTMIVQLALSKAKDMTQMCSMPVFIILIQMANPSSWQRKGLCAIKIIATTLDQDLRSCLLIAHAMSGYDAASATFGMGKVEVFNKLKESPNWRCKLQKLLDDDISADKMVGLDEDFYIELYRKIATKATTLDQIRVIMYNLPKYIPLREYQQQAVYSIFTCFVFICKSADGNIWKKCWMQKTTGFTRT